MLKSKFVALGIPVDRDWAESFGVIIRYFEDLAETALQLLDDPARAEDMVFKTCTKAWNRLEVPDLHLINRLSLFKLFFETVRDSGQRSMIVKGHTFSQQSRKPGTMGPRDERSDSCPALAVRTGESLEPSSRLASFLYSDPAVVADMTEKELNTALNVLGIDAPEAVEQSVRLMTGKELSIEAVLRVLKGRIDCEDALPRLRSLPFDLRSVVLLADVKSFTHEEIAEILDISTKRVLSCLKMGRRQLKEHLPVRASSESIWRQLFRLCRESIETAKLRMVLVGRLGGTGGQVLESRQVVGLFLLVLVFSGVFFSLGFVMGRNQYDGHVRAATNSHAKEMNPVLPKQPGGKDTENGASAQTPTGLNGRVRVLVPKKAETTSGNSDWEFYHAGESKKREYRTKSLPPAAGATSKNVPVLVRNTPPLQTGGGQAEMTPEGDYTLLVAAFRKEAAALELATRLQEKKFPAFVLDLQEDKYYYVEVGPYGDRKSADGVWKRLESAGFKAVMKH